MKPYFRSGARLNFWEKYIYECIPLCSGDTSFDNSEGTKMPRALKWFKTSLWNLATKLAPSIKRIRDSKLRHRCSHEFVKLALTEKTNRLGTSEMVKFLLDSGIVRESANRGVLEIVDLCLERFPELMWDKDFPKTLMTEVVNGRQVELFRVVNAYNRAPKLSEDIFMYPDLMEAVVKWQPECVPANVPGAVVLMQREFQWFKVLEERSDPSFKSLKFEVEKGKGKTYWEVFVEQRKDLLKEAGQWMKDTSSSCSLVSTLIVTIAFTAALTVPGGDDSSTGIPIFMKKSSFMLFAVADALALFFSVTATLIFLAIVTPCYTVEDILHSLPRKMIMGINFLFLSLAIMLVAFGYALTIILSEWSKWINIPVTLLAAIPIYFFLNVQFPLYVEMVESIYWPRLYSPLKLRKKRGPDFNFRIVWTKASEDSTTIIP
ncbi:hypothetical protein BT93_C1992 [Corymbia citriodora subsp. variegata]|nr:hypothetical protein BT93_C1992 [Corymbia citriodora subsp. variegata]